MKRPFMMFVVVVASACGGTTSAPTYVPPPAQHVTRHFSGVVLTEDGRAVSGATVFISPSSSLPVNATTDANGSYQLALDQPATWAGVSSAKVTHPLYDDSVNIGVPFAPSQTDVTKNFRLYRFVMAAGQSAHLAITRDNSVGGDDDEFLYRMVHVTVPSSGTLVLDTIADDPSNTVWASIGDYLNYPGQPHVSSSVDTATTIVVAVAVCLDRRCSGSSNMAAAVGFTIQTAFAP